ncbi:MAG TPA: cytosine permease [Actinomycetota bacterium]|jgi:putative hydroxymethylpyrimidine transporter CytX|nr:cytosine permease [Actinomycetota bacterium]
MQTEQRRRFGDVPEWGIDPVPEGLRQFTTIDTAMLWANLGVSLLLPIVAAFLVPGLSFRRAAAAILVGVVIGNVMLGYAGRIGAATGVPAMVLYRPSLGRHGSYAPTALNVLQNVGWGSFELLIIGTAAAAISERALGVELRPVWTLAFGAVVTLMAIGGPLLVVRRWIRRYAVWLVLASSIYLTVYVLTAVPFSTFLNARGDGSGSFWGGVDLVISMPLSWIPLVADYTRFSRTKRAGFAGAGIGYAVAHAWFYFLGVLLILSDIANNPADPTAFVAAVLAVPAGLIALGILAVDETDEAFANIYSASVSVQNVFPSWSQRRLSLAFGAVCTLLAILVPLVQYENFLLLIGAVFVPLFGVLAAHYAIVRRGYGRDDLFGDPKAFRPLGLIAWVAGFVAFNWVNPGTVTWWLDARNWFFDTLLGGPVAPTWVGASLLSFVVAFGLQSTERLIRANR